MVILAPIGANAQTAAPPASASSAQLLKPAELDRLVAPIALYPDPLLAQVLMASAYPLDIVQAERWLEGTQGLKGDQLKAAVDKQPWDDSIEYLVATPDVLQLMSNKLDWTQKLGDAVVARAGRCDGRHPAPAQQGSGQRRCNRPKSGKILA